MGMKNTNETIHARCNLCGGNVGQMPGGRHNLCAARAERGLATPSLGERCGVCDGRGWTATEHVMRGGAIPVYFHPGEMARGLAAIFPPCKACAGRGHDGGGLAIAPSCDLCKDAHSGPGLSCQRCNRYVTTPSQK
jgi:hypothetical protein